MINPRLNQIHQQITDLKRQRNLLDIHLQALEEDLGTLTEELFPAGSIIKYQHTEGTEQDRRTGKVLDTTPTLLVATLQNGQISLDFVVGRNARPLLGQARESFIEHLHAAVVQHGHLLPSTLLAQLQKPAPAPRTTPSPLMLKVLTDEQPYETTCQHLTTLQTLIGLEVSKFTVTVQLPDQDPRKVHVIAHTPEFAQEMAVRKLSHEHKVSPGLIRQQIQFLSTVPVDLYRAAHE